MNRVVPNGTLRGVEGEGQISPIRYSPLSHAYWSVPRKFFRCILAVPWRYVKQPWIILGKDMHSSAVFRWRTGMFTETAAFPVCFWASVFRTECCDKL